MLKNRLGLRRQADLSAFEAVSVALRAEEPLPIGRLSSKHYRAVHRHLFQDVYPWAGRYRTVRMSKDRSPFCYPENIARQMTQLFGQLGANGFLHGRDQDGFIEGAAEFLSNLNAIHPFREGNGRTQLTFLTLLTARAGRRIDLTRLAPEDFLGAMITSFFGDEKPLRKQLQAMLSAGVAP